MSLLGIPVLGDIIDAIGHVADKAIVDVDKKKEIALELEQLKDQSDVRLHDELMGQIEVNKTEAANSSVFVAGWRPFIGWVSGTALGWTFIGSPVIEWASRIFGWHGPMPAIDSSQLMTLVLAMLGLGTMRTIEKVKSVSDPSIKG